MTAAFSKSPTFEAIVIDGYETKRGDNGTLDLICLSCYRWGWADLKAIKAGEHLAWAAKHSKLHADASRPLCIEALR